MVFLLLTIVVTAGVVVLTKGSFRRLARVRLHALWLLLVAFGVQIMLEFASFPEERIEDLGLAILLGTYAMILLFCYLNRRTSGMFVIAIGIAMNVVVIALNGGMPVEGSVEIRNGQKVTVPIERTVKHKPRENDDRLAFLGDNLKLPGDQSRFSLGDIVIGLGIVEFCFEASRRPRRRGEYLPEANWSPTP